MNSTLKPKCLSFHLSVLYLKLKKLSLQPKETQKETEEWKTCETMMKYRSQIIPQFTQAASIASKPNKALLISGLRGSNFEECGKVIEAEARFFLARETCAKDSENPRLATDTCCSLFESP